MTTTLKALLIIVSLITFLFVIHKIRKSQLEIADSVIWILLSFLFVFMSFFDSVVDKVAKFFGFYSTTNFLFTIICFILLAIVFAQNVKISILNDKIKNLNHYIALKGKK